MPLLLAIDCAGPACSVALAAAGKIEASRSVRLARGHAEVLMATIADALAESGADYRDIGCFAVTVGPGSFTGIRTAIAAARGLALALSRPLVGVTTLEAVARGARRAAARGDADCLVALDTRRADLYAQRFAPDGAARTLPVAMMPERLVSTVGAGPLLLAGDAAASLVPLLDARGIAFDGPAGEGFADAADVAGIAAERWNSPNAGDLPPVRPLYLRPPDATKPPAGGRLRP
ncbi:MAG: tRNA (adenosine(37)-N6)-threonylcarbamoyltransferase complex dimerization subunit type 1 TsaB [Defluviicoccus sp.]|nr:tRNA (adenosine(37)-N6)-threonylcarbamoyltransferase complex dimerization subunit type 1 TsaB [Defluviicoccus sp.]MDE0277494.1 tRNA (adenosine(37)-N6)-threonylcarbamoyltransferase complex dimerization subunit type 1 TsaB [Defluviicoccus sp.]